MKIVRYQSVAWIELFWPVAYAAYDMLHTKWNFNSFDMSRQHKFRTQKPEPANEHNEQVEQLHKCNEETACARAFIISLSGGKFHFVIKSNLIKSYRKLVLNRSLVAISVFDHVYPTAIFILICCNEYSIAIQLIAFWLSSSNFLIENSRKFFFVRVYSNQWAGNVCRCNRLF